MRWAAKLKDAENTVAAVGQRRVCHVAVGVGVLARSILFNIYELARK